VRGIGSLRHPGRFAPWLYRIASNVLRDYIRRRGCYRKRPEVRGLDLDLAPAREGSTRTESREELEAALAAVLELPARLREPLLLRHVDDLSYEEIAAILGISANAVQVRIARARERLRRSAVYRRLYAESERERGTVRAEPEPRRVAEIIDLKSVTRRRPAPANSEGHEPCTPAVPGSC
jgi:RNA polymerase sigma factor (sigma-70 family)